MDVRLTNRQRRGRPARQRSRELAGNRYGIRLGLGGRAHGAHTGASAAGHAGVRINVELAVALGDGGNGTFLSARAAGDALVTDLISHDSYLLFYC